MRRISLLRLLSTGVALLCLLSVARAALTDGLIAYYPFHGNANDESGHRHNGVAEKVSLDTDRFGKSA